VRESGLVSLRSVPTLLLAREKWSRRGSHWGGEGGWEFWYTRVLLQLRLSRETHTKGEHEQI